MVADNAEGLVQVRSQLQQDSTEIWTTAKGIIDAFSSEPFKLIILIPTIAVRSFRRQQPIATVALP